MKRILKLLLPFLMAFALCLPVLAEEQRVFDNAGLLDEWEVSMLEDKIQDLRDTYDMDVVLLTLNSLDGKTAEGYADDYYDENGFGENGFGENGMLFLLDMDTRSWYMLTHGTAIYAVTDYGIQEIPPSPRTFPAGITTMPLTAIWMSFTPIFRLTPMGSLSTAIGTITPVPAATNRGPGMTWSTTRTTSHPMTAAMFSIPPRLAFPCWWGPSLVLSHCSSPAGA